jgi:hypothetical protein
MPGGISGADLAEHAHVLRPDLKIMFTSGYSENILTEDRRFGAKVHLLNKPYRRLDLALKLREVIEGR